MRNNTLGPFVPQPFILPPSIKTVNVLFFTNLSVTLVPAFIAILVRSWICELDRGLEDISDSKQRALVSLEASLEASKLIALLPTLIHVSLLLFSTGLVTFLSHMQKPFGVVARASFLYGPSFYGVTTVIVILDSSAPFCSPISRALGLASGEHMLSSLAIIGVAPSLRHCPITSPAHKSHSKGASVATIF